MSAPLVVITDSNLPSGEVEERVLLPAGFEVVRASCRSEDDVVNAAERADALIVLSGRSPGTRLSSAAPLRAASG